MRPPPHITTTIVLGLALAIVASSPAMAQMAWHTPDGLQATCTDVPAVCTAPPEELGPLASHENVIAWTEADGTVQKLTVPAGDVYGLALAVLQARVRTMATPGIFVAFDDIGRVMFFVDADNAAANEAYAAIEKAVADDATAITGTLGETTAVQDLAASSAPAESSTTASGASASRGVVSAQCDCQKLQDAVSAAITAMTSAQKAQEKALIQLNLAEDAMVMACMWLTRIGCNLAGRAVKAALKAWWQSRELVHTTQDILASAEDLLRRCLDRVRDDPACQGDVVSGDQRLGARVYGEPRRSFGLALA